VQLVLFIRFAFFAVKNLRFLSFPAVLPFSHNRWFTLSFLDFGVGRFRMPVLPLFTGPGTICGTIALSLGRFQNPNPSVKCGLGRFVANFFHSPKPPRQKSVLNRA
jgi:hypothetical protein